MVWKSNISTEEANDLIIFLSENVREGISKRAAIGSQLFPVSMYICIACQQLYDQSFEYNAFKHIIEEGGVDPREIGPRCKTVGSVLNGLAFQSMAMLYLHGRGQSVYDWGGPEYEPEEKKEETKYILDIFRHLNPNYRNDGRLLVSESKDKNLRVIDDRLIESLRDEMFDPTSDQIKNFKRIVALITNYCFLDKCECRMGIFEHGPYILDNGELLLFKEFQFMLNKIKGSPIPNLILAYQLKDMKSLEFNDWGTLFANPLDYSEHITKLGMWTHEFIMPLKIKYPDKMGENTPISWETFEEVGKYSQKALKKLYLQVAKWDFERRCVSGARLYTNWVGAYALHGTSMQINMIKAENTRSYIPIFQKYPNGTHPFMKRFQRPINEQQEDPSYYLIAE